MKQKPSLSEEIRSNPETRERMIQGAFKQNPNLESYEEFRMALDDYFYGNSDRHFQDEDLMYLFESLELSSKITQNISQSEYNLLLGEKYYGKYDIKTERPPKEVVLTHTEKGKTIPTYFRYKSHPYTPAQIKFLVVRKSKNIPLNKIVKEYNAHFKGQERTKSAISSRLYRGSSRRQVKKNIKKQEKQTSKSSSFKG